MPLEGYCGGTGLLGVLGPLAPLSTNDQPNLLAISRTYQTFFCLRLRGGLSCHKSVAMLTLAASLIEN